MFKLLLIFTIFVTNVFCTTIQILHTNDLHSYLSGPSPAIGGYFRLKSAIDQLKANALAKGMKTLVLDAGDFGEGSFLFLHNNGLSSLQAFDLLGVDVTVLGNHDYMFGANKLAQQIQESGLRTKILGANISHNDEMGLKGILKANANYKIDGKSIYILGLTTSSPHFMYPLRPGLILPEVPVSRAYTKIAKEDNHDLIIALTHIGLSKDINLVKKDPNIDIVIGGHSHTRLEEALWQNNSKGEAIPIVQTGAHGMALGRLIIDIPDEGKPILKEYELIDMNQYIARDPDTLERIKKIEYEAKSELSNGRWEEIIAESEIDWIGYNNGLISYGDRCWLDHVGEMLKSESGSDVSLFLSNFLGQKINKGTIKYGDIIQNFPHLNEYGKPGWEIMKINLTGWQILSLVTGIVNLGTIGDQVILGGIDFKTFKVPKFIPWIGGKTFFTKFKINNKKLKFKKRYEVALPYELKMLLEGLLSKKLVSYLNLNMTRNYNYIWPMLESYLKKLDTIKCI